MNYQDTILYDIQQITGINNLTKQDLYAIIRNLIKSGKLYAKLPDKYISKYTYESLRRFLLDGDSFISGISIFKEVYNKWKQYQFEHSKEYKELIQKESDDIDKEININNEENMDYVSDELLKDDDVYYENININYMNKLKLYESIINKVAKIVKKKINSLNEMMTKVDSIYDFKNYLQHNVLVFAYTKKDGSIRAAVGTTNSKVLKAIGAPSCNVSSSYGIPYYDLKSLGWRLVALRKGFKQTFAVDLFFEVSSYINMDYFIDEINSVVDELDQDYIAERYNDLLNGRQEDYERSERNWDSEWVNGTYELVFVGPGGKRDVYHNIEPEYIAQKVSQMRQYGYRLISKIPMSDIG